MVQCLVQKKEFHVWTQVHPFELLRKSFVCTLHNGYIHLNMRKNFLTLRVMEHWNRLPGEVVDSPSLEIFKTHLDKVLCSLLWVTLLWQGGWTRWPTEVPSNPYHSVILWSLKKMSAPFKSRLISRSCMEILCLWVSMPVQILLE